MNRRRMLQFALAGTAGALLARSLMLQKYHRLALAFGTTITLTAFARDKATAEAVFDEAIAEVRAVERVADLHKEGSEISRLNASGVLPNPDFRLVEMLQLAAQIHQASAGAFDVSVQPLWLLYDDFAKRGSWPDEAQILAAKSLINQKDVFISRELIRLKAGMALTLNGIAQGYAADRVADIFAEHGIDHAIINTGEFKTRGTAEHGRSWNAGIQNPRDELSILGEFALSGCLATSGDYQYFWSADFAKNHILTPASGTSPEGFASLSVLAKTASLADALSTAAFVLGPEAGLDLLKSFGAEGYGVGKTGKIYKTAGFPALS